MTIQFQGHVVKIEGGTPGKENITFQGAMEYVESGVMIFAVPKDIAKAYRPGTQVLFTVYPNEKKDDIGFTPSVSAL